MQELNDKQVEQEIAKYNRKVESLTDKFLSKMRGFLASKKQKVGEIDQTVEELGNLKNQTLGDIDQLTLTIQRNEERARKTKATSNEHAS